MSFPYLSVRHTFIISQHVKSDRAVEALSRLVVNIAPCLTLNTCVLSTECICVCVFCAIIGTGIAQLVQRLAKGWRVRVSIPDGDEKFSLFHTCLDRPYKCSLPGVSGRPHL